MDYPYGAVLMAHPAAMQSLRLRCCNHSLSGSACLRTKNNSKLRVIASALSIPAPRRAAALSQGMTVMIATVLVPQSRVPPCPTAAQAALSQRSATAAR